MVRTWAMAGPATSRTAHAQPAAETVAVQPQNCLARWFSPAVEAARGRASRGSKERIMGTSHVHVKHYAKMRHRQVKRAPELNPLRRMPLLREMRGRRPWSTQVRREYR